MKAQYADGYIERREVEGRTMYFAQIDTPVLWYGPLRETEAEAVADGQARCRHTGQYVPCFGE